MPDPYWVYDDEGKKFCCCKHHDDGTVILETNKSHIRFDSLMTQVAYPELFSSNRDKKPSIKKFKAS